VQPAETERYRYRYNRICTLFRLSERVF